MDNYSLGSEIAHRDKILYLLGMFIVYLILFFFYIGVPSADKEVLRFYMLFGFILGLVPLLFDLILPKNKNLPLDTVSYEKDAPIPILNSFKVQLFFSLLIMFVMIAIVKYTNAGWIKAPQFHLGLPILSHFGMSPTLINAILSGLTGGFIEVLVFFGFIFPTLYSYFRSQNINDLPALFSAVMLVSLLFTVYHFWVYGYLITDLIKVFIFGIVQALLTYIFRSTLPVFALHFANNFAVILFSVTTYSLRVMF